MEYGFIRLVKWVPEQILALTNLGIPYENDITELLNLRVSNCLAQRFCLNWSLTLKTKSCSCSALFKIESFNQSNSEPQTSHAFVVGGDCPVAP